MRKLYQRSGICNVTFSNNLHNLLHYNLKKTKREIKNEMRFQLCRIHKGIHVFKIGGTPCVQGNDQGLSYKLKVRGSLKVMLTVLAMWLETVGAKLYTVDIVCLNYWRCQIFDLVNLIRDKKLNIYKIISRILSRRVVESDLKAVVVAEPKLVVVQVSKRYDKIYLPRSYVATTLRRKRCRPPRRVRVVNKD